MNWIIYATAIGAGLLAGSFLNVVIYRGPALWGLAEPDRRGRGTFVGPRSYCPACKRRIRIIDLVPVVSYLSLRGKCRDCGAPIPIRYPLVEATGATATLIAVIVFGPTWSALFAGFFLLSLIALGAIDGETGYLPDAITIPLGISGLVLNAGGMFVPFSDAMIGAAAGYGAFALIAWSYEKLRGREGLGGGDAKLLCALGAWGGWPILAQTVFLGSFAALGWILFDRLRGRLLSPGAAVPFGPGLCFGGGAAFLIQGADMPLLWAISPLS